MKRSLKKNAGLGGGYRRISLVSNSVRYNPTSNTTVLLSASGVDAKSGLFSVSVELLAFATRKLLQTMDICPLDVPFYSS